MVSNVFQIPVLPSGSERLAAATADMRRSTLGPLTTAANGIFHGDEENRLLPTALEAFLQAGQMSADSVFASPHGGAFSPLVLSGDVGTGKSTLLHGIAHMAAFHFGCPVREAWVSNSPQPAQTPQEEIVITTGADWCRGYASAVADDRLTCWRERQRQARMFLLDNLSELQKRHQAQHELSLLLDDFQARDVPVLVTSSTPPHAAEWLEPRLASRLQGGLHLVLRPPGPEARREIVAQLAARHGWRLSSTATNWLAHNLQGTVPVLQSTLLQCLTPTAAKNEEISVQEVRKQWRAWEASHRLPLKDLARMVARHFQLSVKDMVSSSRRQSLVRARSVAMYLAKEVAGYSLRDIGSYFAGRDHSTVTHACQKVGELAAQDAELQASLEELKEQLRQRRLAGPAVMSGS